MAKRKKRGLASTSEMLEEAKRLKIRVPTNHVKLIASRMPWKEKGKMLTLTCPNCGKVFFRSQGLAGTVTTCPACHVRVTFDKEGKVKLIDAIELKRRLREQMKTRPQYALEYAREDPKYVKTRFNEMKQHKVPFRTRMQVLSREYGGRGGYTSEELYKIVTGKSVGRYYIFPFVKGAPPEVNRILERTYRSHREAGDTKVAAAIAAWNKVKQAGYVKVTKPAPVWVKKGRYKMLQPMYSIGTAMGGLTERGVRGLWGTARRHKRITGGAGAFGVGYLTAKELERRRKRKKGYQLEHFTPDIPAPKPSLRERLMSRRTKKKPLKTRAARAGKLVGGIATRAAKAAIVGLAAKEILDLISKQRTRAPWMPEIRADVELSGYEEFDQVVQYASVMDVKMLQTLKAKTAAALHKTKTGVERGLLMWLMGFISAELLSRGITKPSRRHEVTFPQEKYVRELRPGEKMPLPVWGYHPVEPREFHPHVVPRVSRRPSRLKKVARVAGSITALPLAALLALRLSKRQEGYSFRSAAKRTLRGVKKVGGGIGKVGGKIYPVALTAMIVSEFLPRKRKPHPPVQPAPGLNHYLFETKAGRDYLWSIQDLGVEEYPFRSAAQRRWMHWKKPKMAAKWEEHTPEGKELPEHVSKHLLGVPILTPIVIAKILANKKKKKQYALPLLRSVWGVSRLHKAKVLGRDLTRWGKEVAARMRTLADASPAGQKITIKGVSTPAKPWFLRQATNWETAAEQAQDLVAKGQLEKLGLLATGTAAGVAAHEVGKKRERERIRKLVG